jgi:hypothetical protein
MLIEEVRAQVDFDQEVSWDGYHVKNLVEKILEGDGI